MKKTLLKVAIAVIGLVVVVVLGVWLLFDANQFRPKVETAMGDALGRKVSVGTIRVALLSGGIAVQDVSIADDPAFSTEPFVTAKAVTIGVDMMPLLLSRSLRIESFHLQEPQVALRRSASGVWNFSKLGEPASASAGANGSAAAMSVVIQKVTISGGRISVEQTTAKGRERRYDDVNAEVTDLSYGSQFPFRIAAKTPGGGTVTVSGTAGPFNTKDATETPFQATIDAKRLDVASSGFVDAASGLAGLIDFSGALIADGRSVNAKGKASATKLQLMPGASPARVPIEIDYESDYSPSKRSGVVKQGDVHVGKAVARLTGEFGAAGDTISVRLKLSGQKMPVTELEAAIPAFGLTLPSGASMRQGTLDIDLAISGPLDRLVMAGPVTISNATVAGFDLGDKLGAVASLARLPKSGETLIQTFRSTLRVAPERIQVDGLDLVAPAIGTLTGAGTIAPKGAMDFKMNAKLVGTAGAGVARIASLGQPANGIPFRIQGTTSNPIFVPDVSGAVGNVMKNPETAKKAADVLRGFFKKKG
jgi:AsmA protein